LTAILCSILKKHMKYELKPDAILNTKTLMNNTGPGASSKRGMLVKMRNVQDKLDMLTACKIAKPLNLYVNENLTRERSRVLAALRKAKRRKPDVVDGCGSRDGSIMVWIKNLNG